MRGMFLCVNVFFKKEWGGGAEGQGDKRRVKIIYNFNDVLSIYSTFIGVESLTFRGPLKPVDLLLTAFRIFTTQSLFPLNPTRVQV